MLKLPFYIAILTKYLIVHLALLKTIISMVEGITYNRDVKIRFRLVQTLRLLNLELDDENTVWINDIGPISMVITLTTAAIAVHSS